MFCAPGLVFGGTEGVMSRFHVLCSRTHFRWCLVHRVPFSYFVLPDSFSELPGASGLVFLFCVPLLIFGGSEGFLSRFHVLRARTRFRRTKGVESRFHVLRVLTHFYRNRGHRVPFSYFASPNSFSTISGVSGPVFMFCVPELIFGGTEDVVSRFLVLCSRARLRRTEGVGSRFHVLLARTHFRRYRGCRVPFS
jgi:hypothetical protein